MSKAQKQTEDLDVQVGNHRMLRVTISGTFGNSKKELVDFEGISGLIPYTPNEDIAEMHVRGRYVEKFLKESLDPKGEPWDKPTDIFSVHIDSIEEVAGTITFVGKNIKELTADEMQDLATQKDLRFIPLPSMRMGRRDMLVRTYVAYAEKIQKRKIKWQSEEFNFAKLPGITLNADERVEDAGKLTNDEIIAMEQGATNLTNKDDPRTRFTLEELKTIADGKGIEYTNEVDFDDLFKQLFKGA